jgi:hypothetical protein
MEVGPAIIDRAGLGRENQKRKINRRLSISAEHGPDPLPVSYQYDVKTQSFQPSTRKNISLARKGHLTGNIQTLTFRVTPLSASRTRVAFTFSGDLGGWIPDFVKTIIQKRWPVRFIQALRDRVANNDRLETPRYRSLDKATLPVNGEP